MRTYVSPVENKKVQMNCLVSPKVKALIEDYANREDRRPGNLGGMLLEWASDQLKVAGDSLTLKRWKAVPASKIIELQTQNAAEVYDAHAQAEPRGKKRKSHHPRGSNDISA